MPDSTTHQKTALDRFRDLAHGWNAESEKAAVREQELTEGISAKKNTLVDLQAQINALSDQAQETASDIRQMEAEYNEVSAARKALSGMGAYGYAVIGLAEKASLTETLTDGQLDASGARDA